jgi:hypothetical protein
MYTIPGILEVEVRRNEVQGLPGQNLEKNKLNKNQKD